MRFSDKVVVVTGAGSGIGKAIALRFAEEGADVVIPEINPEGAAATAEEIEGMGRRTLVLPTDVSSSEQVQAAVAQTLDAFGKIDVLVNNAGVGVYREPFDFSDEEWDWIIGVNLTGVWLFCRYVGPHMVARGEGSIVNVASVGADQASYYRAPYMASKGGVASLTRALAMDLAAKNVRVNAVGPGITATGLTRPTEPRTGSLPPEFGDWLTPMGRWAEPVDIANAVLFLASEEASYVTGHLLKVDGGLSVGNPIGRKWPPVVE